MRRTTLRPPRAGLRQDLAALRRYVWLPAATLAIAIVVALGLGALRPASGQARFRENVMVAALPPLFGPAVLPSPFDYARLATSDGVVQDTAARAGLSPDVVRPRLRAEASFNRPEIDFFVTGPNALPLARAWRASFADAAAQQTPAIQRLLVQDYARQLDQARALLVQRAAEAKAAPEDAVAQSQLKAAQDNVETASRLTQAYDVVAATMKATSLGVAPPHRPSAGVGSTAGRLGAATAAGLIAGIAGALALDWASRRRRVEPEAPTAEPPATFRRREPRVRGGTR